MLLTISQTGTRAGKINGKKDGRSRKADVEICSEISSDHTESVHCGEDNTSLKVREKAVASLRHGSEGDIRGVSVDGLAGISDSETLCRIPPDI